MRLFHIDCIALATNIEPVNKDTVGMYREQTGKLDHVDVRLLTKRTFTSRQYGSHLKVFVTVLAFVRAFVSAGLVLQFWVDSETIEGDSQQYAFAKALKYLSPFPLLNSA